MADNLDDVPHDDAHGEDESSSQDDSTSGPDNIFAGTPLEDIMNSLGPLLGTGGPGGVAGAADAAGIDFNAVLAQVQQLFGGAGNTTGPINFDLARNTARHAIAATEGSDPSPHAAQTAAARDALQLAESWIDRVTVLPAATRSSAAWSRAEWIERTMPTWEVLITPIATHVVNSMGEAIPSEMKAVAGPLLGLLSQASGAMFGQQVGNGIAGLASEVLGSTDIGLPLGPDSVAAVVPTNIAEFAEANSLGESDVLIYVMLREAAHLRLFAHATWLRAALTHAIDDFGRGAKIDTSGLEAKMAGLDHTDPTAIQEAMAGGLFDPDTTPEQQRAKDRLELLLALIEGWVDHVVTRATAEIMPASIALAETMRRRRASGGPAEDTFASLVGLELRPRRLRDAANLWAAIADQSGTEARDAVWSHPDLTPTKEDLDDPLGYTERRAAAQAASAEFDSELQKLLAASDSDDSDDEHRG